MQPRKLIEFMNILEKLKCNLRHSWTSSGRQESVAEHSWRIAVMSLLIADEFSDVDIYKVVKMCLLHDLGEAVTGDIPSFLKTNQDEEAEAIAVKSLLEQLPEDIELEFSNLFSEIKEQTTPEAKLFKALDNLEAVISHNEATLDTWLPCEYEQNLTYGVDSAAYSEYLTALREEIRQDSIAKIDNKHHANREAKPMKNVVVETIMRRRSIRKYKPEQVDESLLSAVIEAGRAAPSGGNAQLAHIIVIQSRDILNEIIRISKKEFAKMPIADDMYASLSSTIEHARNPNFEFDYIYNAPTLIIIANKKGCINAMADSVCVLQNMLIAAEALGLGACYQNPPHWLDDCEGFREYMYTLGLCKDETISCAISLGYPAERPTEPLPRKGNKVTYIRSDSLSTGQNC